MGAAENALLTEMAMALRDKMRLHGISSRAGLERQTASVDEDRRPLNVVLSCSVQGVDSSRAMRPLDWQWPVTRSCSGTRATGAG
ncbi:hypothetical protein [Xanthobacter autotrophicus]|uniref:hypothetical protein n=1 Tax=Xanthobacter autotrophicus TaxID=280 RepID=UPI00372B6025